MEMIHPKEIEDLITKPEVRDTQLRFWDEQRRQTALEAWAEDPRLRVSDVVALAEPFRTELVRKVTGRVFYLQPNPAWNGCPEMKDIPASVWEKQKAEGVLVEKGRKRGETQHVRVDKPTAFPAHEAIHAMLLFGPYSDNEMNRGRLVESTEAEYSEAQRTGKSGKK